MHITNNKPCVLEPQYIPKINGLHDIRAMIKDVLSPIFQPLIATQTVNITSQGKSITEDEVITDIINCCQDFVNGPLEQEMKEFFKDALVNYDGNHTLIQQLFVNQSTVASGLPFASPMMIYTPATDVIPVSKEFLAGQCDYHKYFATMANYVQCDILGFYFANETAFDEFKAWVANEVTTLGNLPVNTTQLLSDFQKVSLDGLTSALRLRARDNCGNEEYSFPRVLMHLLMKYNTVKAGVEYGVLPFNLSELVNPRNVVFVNVERHARSNNLNIKREWDEIKQALQLKVQIISNNQLQQLTASIKNSNNCRIIGQMLSDKKGLERVARVQFGKSAPTKYDLANRISKVMKKMISANKTMNTFKKVSSTYNKPNRRNPDDYNKPGKSTSIAYKPDIHLYVDTSGSISEQDYEDAMKICINMAKKLNVNLYFNSFSSHISTCTKLHVKDKSVTEIWAAFQKIDKVSGGTDFENVWEYINKSPKRKKELSIMITDFCDEIGNHYVECPKNLYYAPCSNKDWRSITHYAKEFCESALHCDPTIRKRLLF